MTIADLEELPIEKSRIIFDPKLWEALEVDREKYPYMFTPRPAVEVVDCPGCGKPTRGRGVPADEMPGTVIRLTANGLCSTCWSSKPELRHRGVPSRTTAPDTITTCPGCGTKTRDKSKNLVDMPGTIRRVNQTGICRACYRKETGRKA